MADDKKDEDSAQSGELIRREAPLPLAAQTGQQRLIGYSPRSPFGRFATEGTWRR